MKSLNSVKGPEDIGDLFKWFILEVNHAYQWGLLCMGVLLKENYHAIFVKRSKEVLIIFCFILGGQDPLAVVLQFVWYDWVMALFKMLSFICIGLLWIKSFKNLVNLPS